MLALSSPLSSRSFRMAVAEPTMPACANSRPPLVLACAPQGFFDALPPQPHCALI
jgi:hypothetical protein